MNNGATIDAIRDYWNHYVHDIEIAQHPIGTKEFFDELSAYRLEKLEYLLPIIEGNDLKGKRLLEIGCGIGTELVRFAKQGANVTGIDLCETSIALARKNFVHNALDSNLQVMNGEELRFNDDSFDFIYARMPLQYTQNPDKMVSEIYRVLRKGGMTTLIVFNRHSWLYVLSKLSGKNLLHEDAPVFSSYSVNQFRQLLLNCFDQVYITTEKLPTKTRAYRGLSAYIHNGFLVPLFNMIPKLMVRPFGAHIIATAAK